MKTTHPIPILAVLCTLIGLSAARADIVHNDDVIIDGSLAVGFDAVNGESFGFDTIRLKENNLRIRFDDTSVVASFPRNDWQIIANDSANGGSSYLGIEDNTAGRMVFRVFAGAPSNALVVDSQGDVGIGTSTPSVELHAVSGDTPALRLEQNSSSGFTPQTWDVAGNETNFFIRDVTNGSTLPIRIRPGAGSNSIFVDETGDVGLSTSSPDTELHILQTAAENTELYIENSNATASNAGFRLINSTGTWFVRHNSSGQLVWNLIGDADTEMSLTADGNLNVSGSLAVNSSVLTVPDFVFESGYDLMPLKELGRFIEKKKHLPEIRSASEIKADGTLNMTEMQLKLLQKIEELTLYTLGQEDRISALTARLSTLEKENRELRDDSK